MIDRLNAYRKSWRGRRDVGTPSGAASVFGRGWRILLFCIFVLVVVLRLPHAWVHGRFIDEEATVFLAYAWQHPWAEALFRPFGGYWNFAADATTLLVVGLVKAGIVPLEYAPYCTMAMALAVQLMPAILILTGRAAWLAGRFAVIAALLLVAIAPMTEEVSFNVLHIQFHLALCAALILALDPPGNRIARIGYALLLFAAPLCGPGAIVILPLFALRALVDRDVRRLEQLAPFAAGAIVQLALFYGANPMRGHFPGAGTVAATMFVRLIVMPLLGFGKADMAGKAIYHSQMAGGTGWWWAVAACVLLFGLLLAVTMRRRDAAPWLLVSGLGVAAATFGFGMVIRERFDLFSIGAGERYNLLPLVLIGWTLIALAMRPGGWSRWLCALLCMMMLIEGGVRYFKPLRIYANGPSWRTEVAAWRLDHAHPLAVWPRPWKADLSDVTRSCSPVGPNPGRSQDPRYCESGWVAAFYRMPIAKH